MEHLFKLLILLPCFYFFSWIEKANRDSKFFPIFYYFYWIYITLYALFSLAWTVFFSPIFQYPIEKCGRHQVLGHLAIITTYCFFQFLVNLYLFQKNASLETGTRKV